MFFFIAIFHKILNIVPCAIQWDLAVHRFCTYEFASANPRLHAILLPLSLPTWKPPVYSLCP